MFLKSVAIVSLFACLGVSAQTPQPRGDADKAMRALTWSFDGGSYLGVTTEEVTRENFGKFGLREVRGVAVSKVADGSPAQAAGIQDGDVIVRFNGEEVTSTRKLTRLVSEIAPDHQARITVLRGGSEREIAVTVGSRPAPKFDDGSFSFSFPDLGKMEFPKMPEMPNFPDHPGVFATPPAPGTPAEPFTWHFRSDRQIGVSVTPLTKQLSDHFGVTNGALINNVREDSPAAKAGLKAGDIIVEVEGIEIKGDFDIIRAIGEKKEGDVSVTFVRDRNRQTVRVTPEKGKGAFDMYFERSEPGKPGEMKLLRPAPHPAPAPVPLNHMVFPGRVV